MKIYKKARNILWIVENLHLIKKIRTLHLPKNINQNKKNIKHLQSLKKIKFSKSKKSLNPHIIYRKIIEVNNQNNIQMKKMLKKALIKRILKVLIKTMNIKRKTEVLVTSKEKQVYNRQCKLDLFCKI